jgi:trk system potassium uptake protein TrkA
MHIVIVGAGPIGAGLAELAIEEGHNVVVIEAVEERARAVLQRYDLQVFHADIADKAVLNEVNLGRADALIATTEDDKTNLMAIALAKERDVDTLISTVNVEGHEPLFESMGATILDSPQRVIAEHLYGFLRYPEYEGIVPLVGGKHAFKLTVSEGAPLAGRPLVETVEGGLLPEGLLIVLLQRGDELVVPTGDTELQAGDVLTLLADEPIGDRYLKAFTG